MPNWEAAWLEKCAPVNKWSDEAHLEKFEVESTHFDEALVLKFQFQEIRTVFRWEFSECLLKALANLLMG